MSFLNLVYGRMKQNDHHTGHCCNYCPNMCHCHLASSTHLQRDKFAEGKAELILRKKHSVWVTKDQFRTQAKALIANM